MNERRSARTRIASAAFRHRGSALAGSLVRFAFAHGSKALPVRRLAETEHVLSFRHPVPGFEPVHVLLVPKLSVPSLMHFTDEERLLISAEVEQLACESLERLGLSAAGFLVLVNGGRRQDVRQVHFHLLTDGYQLSATLPGLQRETWMEIPDPSCEVHHVHRGPQPLLSGLTHAAEVRHSLQLDERGYSIIWDARVSDADGLVHLTAGGKQR